MFDEATLSAEPWTQVVRVSRRARRPARRWCRSPSRAGTRSRTTWWRLVVREAGTTVGVPADGPGVTDLPPGAIARLHPPTPNPFNPVTHLRFDLARPATVTFGIYDVRGRLVRTLVAGELPAGIHEATWDGRDADGRTQAAGVYLARLDVGAESHTQRLVLLK